MTVATPTVNTSTLGNAAKDPALVSGLAAAETERATWAARQAEQDTRRHAEETDREAELGPAEAGLTRMLDTPLPKPPAAQTMPEPPSGPIVDSKDYQGLATALLGMALIGGVASKGNWLGVMAPLNGALKGYLEGNEQKRDEQWKEFQAKYKAAQDRETQANKEFQDVLESDKLTINEKLTQNKLLAAKWGRRDMALEADQKSIDGLWNQYNAHLQSLVKTQEHAESVIVQVNGAMERARTTGRNQRRLSDEAIDLIVDQMLAGDIQAKSIVSSYDLPDRAEMANRMAQVAKERHISGAQLAANIALLKGETGAIRVAEVREVSVERLARSIENIGPILDKVARQGVAKGVPFTNKRIQDLASALGDPAVTKLDTVVRETATQFVEAMTMPGSNAQMHEGARQVGEMILNRNMTYTQIKEVYALMKQILASNRQALQSIVADEAAKIGRQGQGGASPAMSLDDYLKSQGH